MEPQSAADIEWGLRELKARGLVYKLYLDYYDGTHRLAFATANWTSSFGRIFSAFADNLCPAVVNAVRNRLEVIGFSEAGDSVDGETGAATPGDDRVGGPTGIADAAWDVWNRNRMDRRQKELFRESLIGGDSYAIVWTHPEDEKRAVIYPNRADQCVVRFDEEIPGRRSVALKGWATPDKRGRVNLYYRDRIEKYVTRSTLSGGGLPGKAQAWTEYEGTPTDPTAAIVPHDLEVVPVVPFSFDATTGRPGRPRLTDVLPIQDALNKSLADLLVAMEFQAIPQRWVVGYTPEIDPDTGLEKQPFIPGADRVWGASDPNTQFGQFDAANLEQMLAVTDSFRAETARVSGTPLHYLLLSGSFPSGEALRAAESPLEAIVADAKAGYGSSFEETLAIALRIENAGSDSLTTLWRDSTSRGAKEHAETLEIKRGLGVPQAQILRELGYSDPEIEAMREEDLEDRRVVDAEGIPSSPPPPVTSPIRATANTSA